MKVKIGDTIYQGKDQPVMVILTDKDKENIANMLPEATKYCEFPDSITEDEAQEWMAENKTIEEIWDKYDEKHDRGELTVAELRNGCIRILEGEGEHAGRFIIKPFTRALIDGEEIVWFLPDFTWTYYDRIKDLKAKEARIKGY